MGNYILNKKKSEIVDKGFIVGDRFISIGKGGINISKDGLMFQFLTDGTMDKPYIEEGRSLSWDKTFSYDIVDKVPCIDFDKNNRIQNKSYTNFPANNVSFSLWIKIKRISGNNMLLLGYGQDNVWRVHVVSICNSCYGYERASGQVSSGITAVLNEWTHVCNVLTNEGVKIYVNGELIYTDGNTFNMPNSGVFAIGGWIGGGYEASSVYVANPRIYSRCLEEEEILVLSKEFKI